MDIKGKIIQKMDLQSGVSKIGNQWKKQEYVMETFDSYPKKVKFDFFGDRADQYPLEVGDVITLSYDIESREFNGRRQGECRHGRCTRSLCFGACRRTGSCAGSRSRCHGRTHTSGQPV